MIVVLDTGGVEGLAPIDQTRRARLRELRSSASDIVVPAVVLAEGVFTGRANHDFHVRALLTSVDVCDVGRTRAEAAGALRQSARRAGLNPPPSATDVLVAAEADFRAERDHVQIVTSDGDDFEVLASLLPNADRISLLVV